MKFLLQIFCTYQEKNKGGWTESCLLLTKQRETVSLLVKYTPWATTTFFPSSHPSLSCCMCLEKTKLFT